APPLVGTHHPATFGSGWKVPSTALASASSLPRHHFACPCLTYSHRIPPSWHPLLAFGKLRNSRCGTRKRELLLQPNWSHPPGAQEMDRTTRASTALQRLVVLLPLPTGTARCPRSRGLVSEQWTRSLCSYQVPSAGSARACSPRSSNGAPPAQEVGWRPHTAMATGRSIRVRA